MERVLGILVIIGGLIAAIGPFAVLLTELRVTPLGLIVFTIGNLAGWCLVAALFLSRREMRKGVSRIAAQFGIETRMKSFEKLVHILLEAVERKNSALIPQLLTGRISSKDELSVTLQKIVGHAYSLLGAESAELALYDKESGMYHSSIVLGKPFRRNAQAMLSGATSDGDPDQEASPDVLIENLAFGGSMLGTLRIGLKRGSLPSQGDREIMNLLALQGSLAVINAQYTNEMMRMRHVSDESIKVKTGFLANLSHEIRAPLGIMLNAAELVLDGLCGPVNDEQTETLELVKSNGAHLLELINDVLDYAKGESGKLMPSKVQLPVDDMLKDILSVVKTQSDAKGHNVNCRSAVQPLAVSCDRRHFRQMLINLMTNAIKYTPEHGSIEVWPEKVPGGQVKINVKDSGVGIEEADRSKVFAPFERISNAYSMKQVGTGLGMPLTRRLVEINGGSIDFSSVPGKGSHFWLLLPSADIDEVEEEEEQTQIQVRGRGELILLLEPDDGERKMLEKHLTHTGFRAVACGNRAEALERLRQDRFQLAVLDNSVLDNPEEDLLTAIRDNTRSARLPVVLLSSRAFVFDIEKYLKAGVDRCLSKPVSMKELAANCRELIDGHA